MRVPHLFVDGIGVEDESFGKSPTCVEGAHRYEVVWQIKLVGVEMHIQQKCILQWYK